MKQINNNDDDNNTNIKHVVLYKNKIKINMSTITSNFTLINNGRQAITNNYITIRYLQMLDVVQLGGV